MGEKKEVRVISADWRYFNPKLNRGALEAPFGIACYSGYMDGQSFHGTHQGIVSTREEAIKFCDGDDSIKLIKVYGTAGEEK